MTDIMKALYEKYAAEFTPLLQEDIMSLAQFEETYGTKLCQMNCIEHEQGVLFYYTYKEGAVQVCVVPVYGYCAASERVLTELFSRLSAQLTAQAATQFQVHLYAHDLPAQRLFSMLQFGYMAETGIRKAALPAPPPNFGVMLRTLGKDELRQRWDEVWSMTSAILECLRQAPVFYPCEEFTEDLYRDFLLDEETQLHIAFDADGNMIGMIETNTDTNAATEAPTANVGEIYVLPAYRGTGLSDALLSYAADSVRRKGARYLWVEHGTANPNARRFWGKHFESYEYEMDRTISCSQRNRGKEL